MKDKLFTNNPRQELVARLRSWSVRLNQDAEAYRLRLYCIKTHQYKQMLLRSQDLMSAANHIDRIRSSPRKKKIE